MKRALVLALMANPAMVELRNEEHPVGDWLVTISVLGQQESLRIGPGKDDQLQILAGGDVTLVALAGDADSAARLGAPVLVAEVAGTHSCETGDARAYYVVTLGDLPGPEGPLTTCEALSVRLSPGALRLDGASEAWSWVPGRGFRAE